MNYFINLISNQQTMKIVKYMSFIAGVSAQTLRSQVKIYTNLYVVLYEDFQTKT